MINQFALTKNYVDNLTAFLKNLPTAKEERKPLAKPTPKLAPKVAKTAPVSKLAPKVAKTAPEPKPVSKLVSDTLTGVWLDQHEDKLFWAFYILRYGASAYMHCTVLRRGDELGERATKKGEIAQDLSSKTKPYRDQFKLLKWQTLKSISEHLSPCSPLKLISFCCLCVLYNIPILITVVRANEDNIYVRTHESLPNGSKWRRLRYWVGSGRVLLEDSTEYLHQFVFIGKPLAKKDVKSDADKRVSPALLAEF